MLIEGARRVGKTTIARKFAHDEYATSLCIDFSNLPDDVRDAFLNSRHDFDRFFQRLKAAYDADLRERDCLVIFDEVQLLPVARGFIKHLVADGRYDYLETGSLISLRRNVKDIVIPSEELRMELDPLDFEEWLWAMGASSLAGDIRQAFEDGQPLDDGLHREAMRHFREYLLVGGMPQAVSAFDVRKDFGDADLVKRDILAIYREDLAKYGNGDAVKVAAIFDEMPGQLSKHEKRFTLASLGRSARYRDYEGGVLARRLAGGQRLPQLHRPERGSAPA